ncbi:glycosyl transferase family 4, partial [Nanoarchaeota archaeon NZ13-N]
MIEYFLSIFILLFSFLLTYSLVKRWIVLGKELGLVGRDLNKYEKPEVTEIGGFFVLLSVCISILLYVALKVYLIKTTFNLLQIFVIETVVSLSLIIGILD